jgi:hypothetical protein
MPPKSLEGGLFGEAFYTFTKYLSYLLKYFVVKKSSLN